MEVFEIFIYMEAVSGKLPAVLYVFSRRDEDKRTCSFHTKHVLKRSGSFNIYVHVNSHHYNDIKTRLFSAEIKLLTYCHQREAHSEDNRREYVI